MESDSEGYHIWTLEEVRQYEAVPAIGTQDSGVQTSSAWDQSTSVMAS